MIKKYIKTFLLVLFGLLFFISRADDIIDKPNPPRLLNDFSGIFSNDENIRLEKKLSDFANSTSTQIVVVVLNDLAGYEAGDYAQRLGQKWGVGEAGKNNGIVILIKPTGNAGQKKVFISIGYGLEAIIPDITAKRIVEAEMIPYFKENRFYEGVDKATSVLMSLAKKEFSAGDYEKKLNKKNLIELFVFLAIILGVFIAVIVFSIRSKAKLLSSGKDVSFWTLLWLMSTMNSGSGHKGSWGGFSGGGGSSGFGGFGGGSFGGGGAGGSW